MWDSIQGSGEEMMKLNWIDHGLSVEVEVKRPFVWFVSFANNGLDNLDGTFHVDRLQHLALS